MGGKKYSSVLLIPILVLYVFCVACYSQHSYRVQTDIQHSKDAIRVVEA